MNNPKVSIIVPIYNVEQYLPYCIDSILAQSFTDFELLLIDDGSHDKSRKICDEYAEKDSRIRVFHKKNGGVSSARNIGLYNAQGEWIAFIDSDDWVGENWLNGFVSSDLSADLIIQGFYAKNWPYAKTTEEINISLKECLFKNEDIVECINYLHNFHNVGFLWCRFFKKRIIDDFNIRFNESFPLREDQEFIFHYMTKIDSIKTLAISEYHYDCPHYNVKYRSIPFKLDIDITLAILNHINTITTIKNTNIHIETANRISASILSKTMHDFNLKTVRFYSNTIYNLCKEIKYNKLNLKTILLFMLSAIFK